MKVQERAAQIWPILSLAAFNRQILTYTIIGDLIGVPQYALAKLLEPIQSYCIINKLPALTVLVVDKRGKPGTGFIAASDISEAQQTVFRFDWLKHTTPLPDEFKEALGELKSCGIPEAVLYHSEHLDQENAND